MNWKKLDRRFTKRNEGARTALVFQAGHQDLLGARKGTEPPSRVLGGFFILSAHPHAKFCVDDICVRENKEGQSAAGAPMLRNTVEAPTA